MLQQRLVKRTQLIKTLIPADRLHFTPANIVNISCFYFLIIQQKSHRENDKETGLVNTQVSISNTISYTLCVIWRFFFSQSGFYFDFDFRFGEKIPIVIRKNMLTVDPYSVESEFPSFIYWGLCSTFRWFRLSFFYFIRH